MIFVFCSSLQYRSALVATRMRNIVFILLLIGLPLGGAHQGYGGNLMTASDHMFQNGTEEQSSIC